MRPRMRSTYPWDVGVRGGLGRLTKREQTARAGKRITVSTKGASTTADAMIALAQRMAFAMKCFRFIATSNVAKIYRLMKQANRRPAAGAQPRMRDVRVERRVSPHLVTHDPPDFENGKSAGTRWL
jgi:hypothetical protein